MNTIPQILCTFPLILYTTKLQVRARLIILNIMAISEEESIYEEHQFVIIGAGISGLQAGIILAQNKKDFVIL